MNEIKQLIIDRRTSLLIKVVMPECAHCNQPAELKCSSCGLAYYCGKDHQKIEWKTHKRQCILYKIEQNDRLGRYMIANRDIKAGCVIMKKTPLVAGPKMISYPVCLGCHRRLNADCIQCTNCKWELCSSQCEKSSWHVQECKCLARSDVRLPQVKFGEKTSRYAIILPLRALLLKSINAKQFDELMSLQSHIENNMPKRIYDYLSKTLIPLLRKIKVPLTTEINPLQICAIFDTNAFEVRDDDINIRAVYPLISFLSHDCTPNTRHICDSNFAMSVIATTDIRKGELISTTYTQTLWPTIARRTHLRNVKHFDCVCRRCSDPTELQTFVGSLKCQICMKGLLLSTDPLNHSAPWKCMKCNNQVGAYQVETLNAQIRKELMNMPRTPRDFEAMLINYTHLLHEFNTHALEIKYALVQLYGNANGTHPELEEGLKRRMEICQELLKVSSILEPGCSSFNETLENSIRMAKINLGMNLQ